MVIETVDELDWGKLTLHSRVGNANDTTIADKSPIPSIQRTVSAKAQALFAFPCTWETSLVLLALALLLSRPSPRLR